MLCVSRSVCGQGTQFPRDVAERAEDELGAPGIAAPEDADELHTIAGNLKDICAAIAATHPGPMKTYATIEGGSPKITDAVAPLIAVPTTAGTGSEVARGAIVIVDDGRKLGFHSWHLVPRAAICDPELTLGLPRLLTAATGMDAIAHCMETFMAPAVNPPADGIARGGLARGWAHLERAVRGGRDLEVALCPALLVVRVGLGDDRRGHPVCVAELGVGLGEAQP